MWWIEQAVHAALGALFAAFFRYIGGAFLEPSTASVVAGIASSWLGLARELEQNHGDAVTAGDGSFADSLLDAFFWCLGAYIGSVA